MSSAYLIVEAGSTKSDWVLCQSGQIIRQFRGVGINPTTSNIAPLIPEALELITAADRIYYYGAGINNQKSKDTIQRFLAAPKKVQSIENDIMAVVKSQTPDNDAIVGILGTGSVAFLWKNGKLVEGCPSLGFILSDEGAGSNIGQAIIKSYFYKTMPAKIKNQFELRYPNLDRFVFLHNLYHEKKQQSAYLASFTLFLSELGDNEWKTNLLRTCFKSFFTSRVQYFDNSQNLPIFLSGSIAYVFQKEIISVFYDYLSPSHGIKVCKSPLKGLIDYHDSY